MRSSIGNSANDPIYVTQTTATTGADGSPITASGTSSNPTVSKSQSAPNMAASQVAVTTSATLVAAARATRQSVTITSDTAVKFYVGGSGVTTGTGFPVQATAGASITITTTAAVYAIGASAVTVGVLDLY